MADIRDRSPSNLDWALLSKRGCPRCEAQAGEPHTFPCANLRIAEAKKVRLGRAYGMGEIKVGLITGEYPSDE